MRNIEIRGAFFDGFDHGAALELDCLIKPVSTSDLARALARQGFALEQGGGDRAILVVDDSAVDRRLVLSDVA